MQAHLNYAKEFIQLLQIKTYQIVKRYHCRKANTEYHTRSTILSVTHGEDSIMLGGCFSSGGLGELINQERLENELFEIPRYFHTKHSVLHQKAENEEEILIPS